MKLLIPVKNRKSAERIHAKQRMSPLLNAQQRLQLVKVMLQDMLEVLQEVSDIEICLVTNDPLGAELQQQYCLQLLPEHLSKQPNLNSTLQETVARLSEQQEQDIAILHGDIPLITAEELQSLLANYRQQATPSWLIVPDTQQNGSNCVIFNTGSRPWFAYGNHSFQRHCRQATQQGINLIAAHSTAIGQDMDSPADLLRLVNHPDDERAKHTRNYLQSININSQFTNVERSTVTGVRTPQTILAQQRSNG